MQMRSLLLAAALAPAAFLSACNGATENRGLESVHQPVVERADFTFDVNAGPAGLAPGEAARLAGWFASMRLGYGDRVAVDDPAGALRVHDEVAGQVARFGLILADEPPMTSTPIAAGTARIVVSRVRATVPGCPDFSNYRGPDFESNTNSNHGCAINSNLAAMIADPVDLVRGNTGTGKYDAMVSNKAIDAYRKAPPSGNGGTTLKVQSTGGK